MTSLDLVRRPPISIAVWPAVAFAAFAVAGLRAVLFAVGQAGAAPSIEQTLGGVDWGGLAWLSIGLATPAGLLSLIQVWLVRRRGQDSTIVSILIAVAAVGALWFAFQAGPDAFEAAVAAARPA